MLVTVEASSVFDSDDQYWGPFFAIDGQQSRAYIGFYQSEREVDPWLRVTFRDLVYVISVVVTHRLDCCQYNFNNAFVALKSSSINGTWIQCGEVFEGPKRDNNPKTVFNCHNPTLASEMRLALTGIRKILQVNEIEVVYKEFGKHKPIPKLLDYTKVTFFCYIRQTRGYWPSTR